MSSDLSKSSNNRLVAPDPDLSFVDLTGESGTATKLGRCKGKTFKEACISWAKQNTAFNKYFNVDKLTYWGCRLFDNESDARKAFG